jgi:glycosyltransferase involved in cell wall biosynthesis
MLDSTLLIAIITKNVERYITDVLLNAETYSKFFKDYRVIIIDGHSKDKTYQICKEWCDKDDRRKVLQQYNNGLARPLMLEQARNMYIDYFEPYFGKDTYLLCLDADEINAKPLTIDSFISNFKHKNWDAMFANQTDEYYDIWALRKDDCDYDCWEMVRKTNDISYVNRHHRNIDPNSSLIPVYSAFGGTAIYNTRLLKGIRYYSFVSGNEICEHVPFNTELNRRGGKLYINPMFINK